jgi:hypothetical protein
MTDNYINIKHVNLSPSGEYESSTSNYFMASGTIVKQLNGKDTIVHQFDIMESPNGNNWKLSVNNLGVIVITAL